MGTGTHDPDDTLQAERGGHEPQRGETRRVRPTRIFPIAINPDQSNSIHTPHITRLSARTLIRETPLSWRTYPAIPLSPLQYAQSAAAKSKNPCPIVALINHTLLCGPILSPSLPRLVPRRKERRLQRACLSGIWKPEVEWRPKVRAMARPSWATPPL